MEGVEKLIADIKSLKASIEIAEKMCGIKSPTHIEISVNSHTERYCMAIPVSPEFSADWDGLAEVLDARIASLYAKLEPLNKKMEIFKSILGG